MKKVLKYFVIALLVLAALGFFTFLAVDEDVPEGTPGREAEQLTDLMWDALNKAAYDSIRYIEFSFKGVHSYQWDRADKKVTISWDDQKVSLDLNVGPENYTALEYTAYKYFINDSFWLVAPFKAKDTGVTRSVVDVTSGKGLLVSYASGGVTPGDSYLWILDDKGFPQAWKLWTSNVPIGGLTFTWEGWEAYERVYFSTLHKSAILELDISNLKVSY